MNNIIIKKSTDQEKAFRIAKSLPDYFNEHGLEEIQKAVKDEILFGAYIDDNMIGFVTYKELNLQAIELTWMGILKEYQGQGIGTRLVNESLKEIDSNFQVCEVKTLAETQPDPGYEKTRNFYKKLGFIPIEIISPYPGWGEENPCQILVKYLNLKKALL